MELDIRDYELSIWTVQDDFITVLKPAQRKTQGQIQNGEFKNNVDGTMSLTFEIPMYIYRGKERIENPIWENTTNGVIIADLKKVKLIFNKGEQGEKIYELLIIKVEESHEDNVLTCKVECEGLAFHELGKQGYKISLTTDDYINDVTDWYNSTPVEIQMAMERGDPTPGYYPMPQASLEYWMNKFMEPLPNDAYNLLINNHFENVYFTDPQTIIFPNKWYYTIAMNWEGYYNANDREPNKIYEEEYVGSYVWGDEEKTYLTPSALVDKTEKYRLVDLEESNKYNLTQDLAEKFEVFCRYQYLYDANYHIVGRLVVFYNSFFEEKNGYLDITYPYSTSKITRKMDATDVTTKLFVRPVDAEDNSQVDIMELDANKTLEDYILNFNYLDTINSLTKEQKEAIAKFELDIRDSNEKLIKYRDMLIGFEQDYETVKAKCTTLQNMIDESVEELAKISAKRDALTNTGYLTVGYGYTVEKPDDATSDWVNPRNLSDRFPEISMLTLMADQEDYQMEYIIRDIEEEVQNEEEEQTPEEPQEEVDMEPVVTEYDITGHPKIWVAGGGTSEKIVTLSPAPTLKLEEKQKVTYSFKFEYVYSNLDRNQNTVASISIIGPGGTISNDNVSIEHTNSYTVRKECTCTLTEKADSQDGDTINIFTDGQTYKDSVTIRIHLSDRPNYDIYPISLTTTVTGKVTPQEEEQEEEQEPEQEQVEVVPTYPYRWEVKLKDKGVITNINEELLRQLSPELFSSEHLSEKPLVALAIYYKYNTATRLLSIPIKEFKVELDEAGNAVRLYDIILPTVDPETEEKLEMTKQVYLTYTYYPQLYFYKLWAIWSKKQTRDIERLNEQTILRDKLNDCITTMNDWNDAELLRKKQLISDFEECMGPALREGYWQPEDYKDYGDRYTKVIPVTTYYYDKWVYEDGNPNPVRVIDPKGFPIEPDPKDYLQFIWDEEVENNQEQMSYYTVGLDEIEDYYPCYNLNHLGTPVYDFLKDHVRDAVISFKTPGKDGIGREFERTTFAAGSQLELGFIKTAYIMDGYVFETQNIYDDEGAVVDHGEFLYYGPGQDGKYYSYDEHGEPIKNVKVKIPTDNLQEHDDGWIHLDENEIYDTHGDPINTTYQWVAYEAAPCLILTGAQSVVMPYQEETNYGAQDEKLIDYLQTSRANLVLTSSAFYHKWMEAMRTPDSNGLPPDEDIRDANDQVIGKIKYGKYYNNIFTDDTAEINEVHTIVSYKVDLEGNRTDDIVTYELFYLNRELEVYPHYLDGGSLLDNGLLVEIETLYGDKYAPYMGYMYPDILVNKHPMMVYPRFKVDSLKLKDSEDWLRIQIDTVKRYVEETNIEIHQLKLYDDYHVFSRAGLRGGLKEFMGITLNEYTTLKDLEELYDPMTMYISITPSVIFESGIKHLDTGNSETSVPTTLEPIMISYCLSNADLHIYLDALEVSKENAFPKVSYTITPQFYDQTKYREAYNLLTRIVHINDSELKFKNVLGYISEVTLNLDEPNEDSFEIKNYKTKFEDIFSNIVAQSEEMKKRSYSFETAASAFAGDGTINPDALNNIGSLNFYYNNGSLSLTDGEGLMGISDDGAIAFKYDGIHLATEKSGNSWAWTKAISPNGIAAEAITRGQLDLSKLSIYAGDNVFMQMNDQGLFAYKNYMIDAMRLADNGIAYVKDTSNGSDVVVPSSANVVGAVASVNVEEETYTTLQALIEGKDTDALYKQYVRFDEQGLFLTAEKGAQILKKSNKSTQQGLINLNGITAGKTYYSVAGKVAGNEISASSSTIDEYMIKVIDTKKGEQFIIKNECVSANIPPWILLTDDNKLISSCATSKTGGGSNAAEVTVNVTSDTVNFTQAKLIIQYHKEQNGLDVEDAYVRPVAAQVYEYARQQKDVDRVAISWDGLVLKNWNGDTTFYADPDTGNLYISGTLNGNTLRIADEVDWELGNEGRTLDNYLKAKFPGRKELIDDLQALENRTNQTINDIEDNLERTALIIATNNAIFDNINTNIASTYGGTVYKGPAHPTFFAIGDVWYKTEMKQDGSGNDILNIKSENGVYIIDTTITAYEDSAIIESYIAYKNCNNLADTTSEWETSANSHYWTKVSTRANSISGAQLSINPDTGAISLLGNNVQIIGSGSNNTISIGGTNINMAATSSMNFVTSSSPAVNSLALTSSGIDIYSSASINIMQSSGNTQTNAITLDGTNGIWLGSSKGIHFCSNDLDPANLGGANVSITYSAIKLGVARNNNASSVNMTADGILLGVGIVADSINTISATQNSGVSIKGNEIILITSNAGTETGTTTRTGVILDGQGFSAFSSAAKTANEWEEANKDALFTGGSYIKIYPTQFSIGSLTNIDINSNNFKLYTDNRSANPVTRFALGVGLNNINGLDQMTEIERYAAYNTLMNSGSNVGLVFDGSTLSICGNIYAQSGYFTGHVEATSGIFHGAIISTKGYYPDNVSNPTKYYQPFFKADSNDLGMYINSADYSEALDTDVRDNQQTCAIEINNSSVTAHQYATDKLLWFENGELHVKGNIVATNFLLNNQTISTIVTNTIGTSLTPTSYNYYYYGSQTPITNPTTIQSGDWENSIDDIEVSRPYYLCTKQIGIKDGNTLLTTYAITYVPDDGTPGRYIASITPLYYLKTVNKNTAPAKPTDNTNVGSSTDQTDVWCTIVPNIYYTSNNELQTYDGNYYRCEKYIWSDDAPTGTRKITYSEVYIDYGISAAPEAHQAANIAIPFQNNGLLTNYHWGQDGQGNDLIWKVALTSTDNLLVGANSGLWIAKGATYSEGAAVVIDCNGIEMFGKNIKMGAAASLTFGSNNNAVIINDSGIQLKGQSIQLFNTGSADISANGIKIDDWGISIRANANTNDNQRGHFEIRTTSSVNHYTSGNAIKPTINEEFTNTGIITACAINPMHITTQQQGNNILSYVDDFGGLLIESTYTEVAQNYVSITPEAINFTYAEYNSTISDYDTKTNFSVSPGGIALNGANVWVNGARALSEYDIRVLKRGEDLNTVINTMKGNDDIDDWILITPQYVSTPQTTNAVVSWISSKTNGEELNSGQHIIFEGERTPTGNINDPNENKIYQYNITITYRASYTRKAGNNNVQMTIITSDNTDSRSLTIGTSNTGNNKYISLGTNSNFKDVTVTYTVSGSSDNNLFAPNYKLSKISMNNITGYSYYNIKAITITEEVEGSSSGNTSTLDPVTCTVTYYPPGWKLAATNSNS